MISEEYWV